MTGRWLFAAVALLTLVSQVAVSSHIPDLDHEVSWKCRDGSSHFCAERAPEDPGPCSLCQAGSGIVAFTLVTDAGDFAPAGTVPVPRGEAPRIPSTFSPAAPRAPPVL